MIPLYQQAFAKAKSLGLVTVVTTSHSAPYECDTTADAVNLVKAWVVDTNLDIISPQLYSSGYETSPEFAETSSCQAAGCTWNLYKGAHAKFVPSIVKSTQYATVVSYFKQNYGITCQGYIQWAQQIGNSVNESPFLA